MLQRHVRSTLCFAVLAASAAACSGIDKEIASEKIRDRFCGDFGYACTDSTYVQVKKVRKTPNGRSVDFRIIDRDDETAVLSAAYLEPEGDGWILLLFEPPFSTELKARMGWLNEDKKQVSEKLMELRSAQNWHRTIYGRYASEFDALTQVNYRPPESGMRLTVEPNGTAWRAELDGKYMMCWVGSDLLLPECGVGESPDAGTASGPLSAEFGAS